MKTRETVKEKHPLFKRLLGRVRKNPSAVIYIFCVLLPLIITDGVFVLLLFNGEKADAEHGYERAASSIEYLLRSNIEYATNMANNITLSGEVNDFLEKEYDSNYDYFTEYKNISGSTYLRSLYNIYNVALEIYADNDTLISGGGIYPLSKAKNTNWYQTFLQSGQDTMIIFYYDTDNYLVRPRRRLLYIRRMRYYQHGQFEKVIKLEFDYSTFSRSLESLGLDETALLCQGDKMCVSSTGNNYLYDDYKTFSYEDVVYQKDVHASDSDFSIVILRGDSLALKNLNRDIWYVGFLVAINALFPIIYAKLTQSVQKAKLLQQENNIARQNAELLALHSQINPHFLFNALESIRMHSILRGETETAEMVEKLAVIERKNADWNEDEISVSNEMDFVEAYLKLQQYRFGERLNYEIEVEEGLEKIRLPRQTIVTFVENACVHGIEQKSSPGWIFVRVYSKDDDVILEIEDTGEGIPEEDLESLRDKMENASIDKLKEKGRIGIVNACLRLKIATKDRVAFHIESEKGIGTTISVVIPKDCLTNVI